METNPKQSITLKDFLSGEIFRRPAVRKQYKLILLIAVLFALYIHNGFRGQQQLSKIATLQEQLVEAKTILSGHTQHYMSLTRPSYLNSQLRKHGSEVKESVKPAIIINYE